LVGEISRRGPESVSGDPLVVVLEMMWFRPSGDADRQEGPTRPIVRFD
jgi:hypothetical protein